jgi:NitT/TauT family transport system substrate-binding protein
MRSRRGLALIRVGIAVAFLGLLSGGSACAQSLKALSVAVSGRPLFPYLPLTLADRLGFFRDEGLAVTIDDFRGGSKSVEALIGGSTDMAIGAYENTLFVQPKGIELTMVVLLTTRTGLVFALTPAAAAKYHSPRDIKGLKIGISEPGSATDNFLRILLAKAGLTINDVSAIAVGSGAGSAAAVHAGQVDGLINSDPVITELVRQHALVPIVDTSRDEGQNYLYGGPMAATGCFTRADFIKQHRDIVQSFVNAMVRTIKWVHTADPDKVMAAVPPEFYGSDKSDYRERFLTQRQMYTTDGIITLDQARKSYAAVVAGGRIPKTAKIDFAKTFDTSFAKRASGQD